jgi:hypothetical protein
MVVAVAIAGVVTPASAGPEPAGHSQSEHLERLADRTQQMIGATDDDRAHARSSAPASLALGDCGESGVSDPDEGLFVDIIWSAAAADCNGDVGAAVLTYDSWADSELDAFAVQLDTDLDPATGCQGYEYTIVVLQHLGTFPGVIFPENAACTETDPVADIAGFRDTHTDWIAVVWNRYDIGNPSSFAFTTATRSVYSSEFDFAPNAGSSQPVLTITTGPIPEPRSIAPACTFPGGFEDGFTDVPSTNAHEPAIDCIVYWEITTGVRPGIYDPRRGVTRAQMASFLARFIERSGGSLPGAPPDAFPDDDGSVHESNIDKLAAAGVAGGRTDGTFGPNLTVTRAQMATFIVRALEYRLDGPVNAGETPPDYFSDDDSSTHEGNINKAGAVGITGGTGGTEYEPQSDVRRDQMASFLARGLAELVDEGVASIP